MKRAGQPQPRPFGWFTTAVCPAILWVLAAGCGASIQAVYEGDIRFEHCMALDARTDVKSQVRQQCWVEWVAFYTYGQTRDRVIHAQLRLKQLSGLSDTGQAADRSADSPLTAPAPTSALAPPPLMTNHVDPDSSPPPDEPPSKADTGCGRECKALRDDCGRACTTTGCRTTCSTSFISCLEACS